MYGLFGLFGAFALAGCQNETLPADGVAADGEGNVMFTLSAPKPWKQAARHWVPTATVPWAD